MKKKNCWEFKKCGREKDGIKVDELGVCPAAVEKKLDGVHSGKNGGRACWVIVGTMCSGKVQGTFAHKYKNCGVCDFYNSVRKQEGGNLVTTIVLLKKLE